jgi:hypothetical protein
MSTHELIGEEGEDGPASVAEDHRARVEHLLVHLERAVGARLEEALRAERVRLRVYLWVV